MANSPVAKLTHALRYFLLRRLPTCKQMTALMSQSMERPLTLRERGQMRLHLWICIWCVWYMEHLHVLHDALQLQQHAAQADDAAASLPAQQLSPEARERLKRALESNS